jgi:hypothetical protein
VGGKMGGAYLSPIKKCVKLDYADLNDNVKLRK